ncbi:MAG: insulinase family protein [Clostridia bacterium]|nr:insulinase family protein [Clostridia bacterium]
MEKMRNISIPEQYEIKNKEYIDDINSTGYILRHKKSGARVAVIPNDDDNKLFCITFFTPPDNSKGTPHIIEHTVLQGSRKYPAREPFMQLVKGSLNTFLNAMTYPDKTMYPVASCNDVDFKNLMDVYLDAVFHPNLYNRREIFMQEGWHYETDQNGDLSINGVVYSEMKGKSSSPDSNVFDEMLSALFPDNAYGFCSGGDPREIPDLSYEEYLDFHRKLYHPSNSFIMIYGNSDAEERLEYLDREYLSEYDTVPSIPGIPPQKEFGLGNPKNIEIPYPVGNDEDVQNKTYLAVAYRVGSVFDEVGSVAWNVLGDILVNDPESFIKRALSDAGIGQEIYGGYLDYIGEPVFAVVAKNTESARKEDFLRIINDTLVRLRKEGINKKTLSAILERTEFNFRESDYGSYPKGLHLFRLMLKGWLYGDNDPFKYVKILRILEKLKEKVNDGYFEELLDSLISPSHSVVLTLIPEHGLASKEEDELNKKLIAYKDSLTESDYKKIEKEFNDLRDYQEAPETEEERNCIPVLPRGSIPVDPLPVSNVESTYNGVRTISHDIDTNGIVYVRFLFDVSDLSEEKLPYLDLLVELLGNCSAGSYETRDLIDEIRTATGGIDFDLTTLRKYRDPDAFSSYLTVSVRTLEEKTEAAFDLVRTILTETRLDNVQRIKEVLGETVSVKSYNAVYSGSEFAAMRSLGAFDPASVFNDMTEGIGSLRIQSALYSEFEKHSESIIRELKHLYEIVFDKNRAVISLAAPKGSEKRVHKATDSVTEKLDRGNTLVSNNPLFARGIHNEAFTSTSSVQYVSLCSDLGLTDEKFRLITPLISRTVTNEILYPEIRVKGGAYGAYCSVVPGTGKIVMCSYRDPGLLGTVNVFKSIYEKLKAAMPDDDKLWQLVIGTFSSSDRPLSAYQKACRSMNLLLSGKDISDIRREREAILSVTESEFRESVRCLEKVNLLSSVCVIGGENAINSSEPFFDSVNKLF